MNISNRTLERFDGFRDGSDTMKAKVLEMLAKRTSRLDPDMDEEVFDELSTLIVLVKAL